MTYKVKKRKKLTERKLKALIKDEYNATREYASLGFKNLSRDENKHKGILTTKLNALKKRRLIAKYKEMGWE